MTRVVRSTRLNASIALPGAVVIALVTGWAGAQTEPPAAASSNPGPTPAQEAAEILASGRFLAPLIPEGGHLVRAKGSLGRDEFLGVWTLELADRVNGASNRSLILLPTEALADMIRLHEKVTRDGTTAPLFEVSGAVLVYRKTNFVMPSMAVPIDRRVAPAEIGLSIAPGTTAPASSPKPVAPAAEPVSNAPVDPEQFASDIEKRLNQRIDTVASSADSSAPAQPAAPGTQQPTLAVAPATDDGAPTMPMIDASTNHSGASGSTSGELLPPMRLQSRRGALTRDPISGTYRFILASGSKDDGDVALELLPCSVLTQLIAGQRSSTPATAVLISGEVTVFEGRNYLRPTRTQSLKAGKWISP